MRTVLRRVALGVAALVGLVLVLAAGAAAVGSSRIARTYDVTPVALTIPTDSASVARGAHLADIYGCTDCHGADLSGQVMMDEPPVRLVASNLTALSDDYSDVDWNRAIRHGVRPDGSALFVMPSSAYHKVSDEEAAALIAFLQTRPAVEKSLPTSEWRLVGRIMAAGLFDPGMEVDPSPTAATSPPPGATVEYGRYLATAMCAHCHGADLRGAETAGDPDAPPAPDLVAASQWPTEIFHRSLTTGVTITGRQLDPMYMPWRSTAKMTPDEREGIRLYLASLAATPG